MSTEKMENTLDSIRPSENLTEQEEMSYLFGRDPSILAYGQRRSLITDGLKENLISPCDDEETDSRHTTSFLSPLSETVKVYLRLKPYPKRIKLTEEQKEAYTILNAKTLLTKLPLMDTNTSCLKRAKNNDTVCRKFTFTQTFSSTISQFELFEHAIKQRMVDFLDGQNSTVMSYGTTNSGKSYTLQGTTVSPGIIPRSLDFVFSNIDPTSVPCYKPIHYCDVICLNSSERLQEIEFKTKLLCLSPIDRNQCVNTYKEMQKLLEQEYPKRQNVSVNAQYSVWVSFAEIYNETIYDLLSVESQKRRIPLKLATDNHGRAFIKGLKTISVNSGSEAYQILMAGQHNLKVATTALNSRSSRSHCIFTIKLLKYHAENASEKVELSTFSFCDLAGSERLKKTLNVGDRLKEAQNINTSLLVLGRCLKSIYEGQIVKQKQEIMGPFRESKLTRLFQKTLSGKERLVLIVNVNPSPDSYIETQNVLNFSAIAKKIIIEPKEIKRKTGTSRFSQIVTQSIKIPTDWDTTDLDSISEKKEPIAALQKSYEDIYLERYEDALNENKKLKREIEFLRSSALNRDLEIRQEMAETFTATMSQMEVEWRNRIKSVEEQQDCLLQWSVARTENFYKNKLVQLGKGKRMRSDINDESDNEDNEDLELENTRLKAKIAALKKAVKEIRESKDILSADKSKATFELAIVKEELKNRENLLEAAQKDSNGEAHNYIAELKVLLAKKDEQIKRLKMFLDEAKDEYITITTDAREMQNRLKEQNETVVENMDLIAELEEQLEHANIHLPEKTKAVEILEDRVEFQTKKLIDAEIIIVEMQSKISQLETDKIALLEDLAKLQEIVIDHDKKSTPRSFQDKSVEHLNIKYLTLDEVKSESQEEKVENRLKTEELLQEKIMDLAMAHDKLSNALSKEMHYENVIEKLQKEVSAANERYEIKAQCLEAYLERITKLEENITKSKKSQETTTKEQEMENEIANLQKELKNMIRLNADSKTDQEMEASMKHVLKQLTETKEALAKMESLYKDTETEKQLCHREIETMTLRLQQYEQNVKILDLLQQSSQERQIENEQLKKMNDELKNSLADKDREMEAFRKNREETAVKYDNLVKSQQEEIERQKREVMRYQELFRRETPNKIEIKTLKDNLKAMKMRYEEAQERLSKLAVQIKDTRENTSDDDVVIHESRSRRKPKKEYLTVSSESYTEVITECSGSESRRITRRAALPPPSVESTLEKKRTMRKKKLFVQSDDACADIDRCENIPPSPAPSSSTRNLRTRRK
ncbi:kinesin-like protein KIF20A isoform X1 [Cephus cinctus]|uniref:Kinesin-like protein KIF20A isoform X1 n=2 Tax=Cephus cinctus TaxID=211228 RepID=A0AAJ7BV11_CEPCN|nr:kinesin-like protein KIF20A isoform X1 [Cephus cinctus]